jgi:hypothetical protein
MAPHAQGLVIPHWWGMAASHRLASCTQVPRDGICTCSDQFRHAMVGVDGVILLRSATQHLFNLGRPPRPPLTLALGI